MSLRLTTGFKRRGAVYTEHTANGNIVIPVGVTSINIGGVGRAGIGTAVVDGSNWRVYTGGAGAAAYKNGIAVSAGQTLSIEATTTAVTVSRSGTALFIVKNGRDSGPKNSGNGGAATTIGEIGGIVSFAGASGSMNQSTTGGTLNGPGSASFFANGVTSTEFNSQKGGRGLNIRTGQNTDISTTHDGVNPGGAGAVFNYYTSTIGSPGGWLIRIFYTAANTFPNNVDFE